MIADLDQTRPTTAFDDKDNDSASTSFNLDDLADDDVSDEFNKDTSLSRAISLNISDDPNESFVEIGLDQHVLVTPTHEADAVPQTHNDVEPIPNDDQIAHMLKCHRITVVENANDSIDEEQPPPPKDLPYKLSEVGEGMEMPSTILSTTFNSSIVSNSFDDNEESDVYSDNEPDKPDVIASKRRRRRRYLLILGAAISFLAAVALAVILGLNNSNRGKDSNISKAEQQSLEASKPLNAAEETNVDTEEPKAIEFEEDDSEDIEVVTMNDDITHSNPGPLRSSTTSPTTPPTPSPTLYPTAQPTAISWNKLCSCPEWDGYNKWKKTLEAMDDDEAKEEVEDEGFDPNFGVYDEFNGEPIGDTSFVLGNSHSIDEVEFSRQEDSKYPSIEVLGATYHSGATYDHDNTPHVVVPLPTSTPLIDGDSLLLIVGGSDEYDCYRGEERWMDLGSRFGKGDDDVEDEYNGWKLLSAEGHYDLNAVVMHRKYVEGVTPTEFEIKRSGTGMMNAWGTLVAVRNLDAGLVADMDVEFVRSCKGCRTGQSRVPGVWGKAGGAVLYAAVFDDPHESKFLNKDISLLTSFYSGDDAMSVGMAPVSTSGWIEPVDMVGKWYERGGGQALGLSISFARDVEQLEPTAFPTVSPIANPTISIVAEGIETDVVKVDVDD